MNGWLLTGKAQVRFLPSGPAMTDNDSPKTPGIGIGYALAQFADALQSAGKSAAKRVEQWTRVLTGMADGSIEVGSRTPVAATPSWVTLEVAHGGFATGGFAAGGALQAHERALLARLGIEGEADARAKLNAYFLSDTGRDELRAMLRDGKFRIDVPEASALLLVTWMMDHGRVESAEKLVETLLPWFTQLRFYPVPHSIPLTEREGTYLRNASTIASLLTTRSANISVMKEREALGVYTPLYDRAVALLLETVRGETPNFARAENGALARQPNGQPVISGGWPCAQYPTDFEPRAKAILADFDTAAEHHLLGKKPHDPKENLAQLRRFLQVLVKDRSQLTGRDVGTIRKILAGFVSKHGLPQSAQHQRTRENQAHQLALPIHADLAHALGASLQQRTPDEGISDDDRTSLIVEHLPSEMKALPRSIDQKLYQCLHAPLDVLLENDVISSAEVLAKCLTNDSANIRARPIKDDQLRRVFAATYLAFRSRRSLLLLNYASQVRFEELPWIAAIDDLTADDPSGYKAAEQLLARTAVLAIRHFPGTIFPNKFVRELYALGTSANRELPWVYEIASDIFMGNFGASFLANAKLAAKPLQGTLYERYYGVSFEQVLRMPMPPKTENSPAISAEFSKYVQSLVPASKPDAKTSFVVANALQIEQSQLLTTHNLATVIEALSLNDTLREYYSLLAAGCLETVIAKLKRLPKGNWRIEMQRAKVAAYAWRQMLVFLSLCTDDEVRTFMRMLDTRVAAQPQEFQRRFAPATKGLALVVAGDRFGPDGTHPSGARRFLGWNAGRHWILPPQAPSKR